MYYNITDSNAWLNDSSASGIYNNLNSWTWTSGTGSNIIAYTSSNCKDLYLIVKKK